MLFNMTADDIKNRCFAFNLGGCKTGFDQNFGYGRANAKRALEAIGDPLFGLPERLPPAVRITEPYWWDTFDPIQSPTFDVVGTIDARDRAFQYSVELAPGVEPNEGDYDTSSHRLGNRGHRPDPGHDSPAGSRQ